MSYTQKFVLEVTLPDKNKWFGEISVSAEHRSYLFADIDRISGEFYIENEDGEWDGGFSLDINEGRWLKTNHKVKTIKVLDKDGFSLDYLAHPLVSGRIEDHVISMDVRKERSREMVM